MKKCQYCKQNAVYHRKISNEYVCKEHFILTVEKKIRKTVRKYKMFSPHDKLAVGISGGKDSLVVLYNVIQIQKYRQSTVPIQAILIDEGILGYREESRMIATKFCDEFGITLHIVEFSDNFGLSLDDSVKLIPNEEFNACTICGTVRRRLLNKKARELGADYLVIGHNLDDQAETFLQNILRNDLLRTLQHPPWGNINDESGYFVPRVKPLMEIPEAEITLYCYFKSFPIQSNPCPYVESYFILRERVQQFLNQLEENSAEVKYNLIRMHENLLGFYNLTSNNGNLNSTSKWGKKNVENFQNQCKLCHEPTGSQRMICYYCELKKKLRILQ
ncbi:MAG: ATP-binding protein [Promethearchaeota archaeon]